MHHAIPSIAHPAATDVAAIVAQRQRERLARLTLRPRQTTARPSRWSHVPLRELFEQHNTVYARSGGRLETGHEPHHSSKSGRCVLVDTTAGRWWCRSCRQGGDAVTLIMALHGWEYPQAARWLEQRYGPPAEALRRRARTPQRGRLRWRRL